MGAVVFTGPSALRCITPTPCGQHATTTQTLQPGLVINSPHSRSAVCCTPVPVQHLHGSSTSAQSWARWKQCLSPPAQYAPSRLLGYQRWGSRDVVYL
jgi:hypothetical protein